MESYKTKSRIITIIVTIIIAGLTYISTMDPNNLAQTLGIYGNYAPLIIVICAAIVNQLSEEKRVTRAEEKIEDNYTKLGYPRIQTEDDKDKDEYETNTTTDDIESTRTEIELTNTETETETHTLGDDEQ